MNRRGMLAAAIGGTAAMTMRTDEVAAADKPKALWVFVGTYTQRGSKGIYRARLDLNSGALTEVELAAETPQPSFVAVHPNGRALFAVSEVSDFQGQKSGALAAFSLDPSNGHLKLLNVESVRGTGPCHVTVDLTGKYAFVANYGGGSVAVVPIGPDGKLAPLSSFIQHQGSSVDKSRQEAPHAHAIYPSPDNKRVLAADLGLDKVLVYRFDPATGALAPNTPPAGTVAAGSGPRHLAFHPNGRFVYVINEMLLTVTAFSYDRQTGSLKELHTLSTLPPGTPPMGSTAEIAIHPSGKFLYGSNRGHDSLAIYAVDGRSGKLTYVTNQSTEGSTPRCFAIEPSGKILLAANQDSDSIVTFRIDSRSGRLAQVGPPIKVPMPVCVAFTPVA